MILDKIYTIIGCILLILFSPMLIAISILIFWMKCIGRSMFIFDCILTPYIKYKVIANNNEAWERSILDRIHRRKYYE